MPLGDVTWRMTYSAASEGMGILLGIEFRIAGINPSHGEQHRTVALFGFLRGLVLGLAGISVAGTAFRCVFGLLSGAGLTISYLLGFVNALVFLFSPALERCIENLPERRLGVAGLGLIFVGIILQSIQYWIVVLKLSAQ
jgi:hypothetical protein